MNNLEILAVILGVSFGITGAVFFLFPFLEKKGVKVQDVLAKVEAVLSGMDAINVVANKLAPNNPVVDILSIVDKYAKVAVHGAEQLYITSQLGKDDRSAKAKETIYAALKVVGIESTPEIEKIIDGAIETEVLALGHKTDSAAAVQTQLEQSNQQLIQQNQQLQAQTVQLKQALSQVQTTVNNVQQ